MKEENAMAKYRILSLDGGGIRGIVTAIILERLSSDESLKGWLDSVDLIARNFYRRTSCSWSGS